MATVTSLGFSIFSRYHGDGVSQARRDLIRLNGTVDRTQRRLNATTAGFRPLVTAAAAFGPALLPVGQALVGVTAGLGAMGATAGSALGVYGIAMKGAIQRTFEMRDAGKALGPNQQLFVSRTDAMSAAWVKFIQSTQPMTLQTAGVAVQGVTAALGRLNPVVRAVHPILLGIAQDFRAWAAGDGLARFINIVKTEGVPALAGLVRAGRDVTAALGIGFRAVLPLVGPIVGWLERGAAAFRRWAEGGGFNRFVANVQGNGPKVRELIAQIWSLFMKLAKITSELAPLSLNLALVFLRLANAIPIALLNALVIAYVALKIATLAHIAVFAVQLLLMRGAAVVMAVIRVATLAWAAAQWLLNAALLANPIGIVVVALALLVGAIVYLATQTRFFQIIWSATWNFIKVVSVAIWNGMRAAALAIWGAMLASWRFICRAMGIVFRAVWTGIRIFAQAVWTGMLIVGRILWGAMRASWGFFAGAMRNTFVAVWRGIRAFGTGTWRAMLIVGRALWGAMNASWRAILGAMRTVWSAVWRGILAVGRSVWRALSSSLKSVLNAMLAAFRGAINGIRIVWNRLRGIVAAPVKFFVNTVYNNGLRKAWNNTAGKIPGVPDLPAARLGFASGGPVFGPGGPRQDKIHAMLSAGEYVINADAVKKIGVQNLDALNGGKGGPSMKNKPNPGVDPSMPGFFLGGIIPNPIDWIKKAASKVKDLVAGVLEWGPNIFKDVGEKALKFTMAPVYGLIGRIGKDRPSGNWGDAISRFGKEGLDALIAFAVGKMPEGGGGNYGAGLAWARTQQGKRYQWGGNGNPSWDCSGFMSAIESVIRGEKPHRRWATGSFPPGAPGWKKNFSSPFMIGITNAGVGHTAGTLLGTNVECRGGKGCIVGPGARGYNDRMFTSRWGLTVKATAGSGGAAKSIARSMLGRFGWGQDQWPDLEALWQRESGWNPRARNPSSGAYGIPQALPASKMASAGADWRTNPATQILWGLGYIKGRYGSPRRANAFQRSHNWYRDGGLVNSYDSGGYLPQGLSLAYNGTGKPEPVGHDIGGVTVQFEHCTFAGGQRDFETMVVHAVSEARRKKRI